MNIPFRLSGIDLLPCASWNGTLVIGAGVFSHGLSCLPNAIGSGGSYENGFFVAKPVGALTKGLIARREPVRDIVSLSKDDLLHGTEFRLVNVRIELTDRPVAEF